MNTSSSTGPQRPLPSNLLLELRPISTLLFGFVKWSATFSVPLTVFSFPRPPPSRRPGPSHFSPTWRSLPRPLRLPMAFAALLSGPQPNLRLPSEVLGQRLHPPSPRRTPSQSLQYCFSRTQCSCFFASCSSALLERRLSTSIRSWTFATIPLAPVGVTRPYHLHTLSSSFSFLLVRPHQHLLSDQVPGSLLDPRFASPRWLDVPISFTA